MYSVCLEAYIELQRIAEATQKCALLMSLPMDSAVGGVGYDVGHLDEHCVRPVSQWDRCKLCFHHALTKNC